MGKYRTLLIVHAYLLILIKEVYSLIWKEWFGILLKYFMLSLWTVTYYDVLLYLPTAAVIIYHKICDLTQMHRFIALEVQWNES